MVPDNLGILIVFDHPQSADLLTAPNAANQLQLIASRSFIGKPVPLQRPMAHMPFCFF